MKRSTFFLAASLLALVAGAVTFSQPFFKYRTQRELVASALKDPDSAKFSNEITSTDGSYCAEVNSKNGYGAYGGFKKVISRSKCSVFFVNGDFYSQESTSDAGVCHSEAHSTDMDIEIAALESMNAARNSSSTAHDYGEGSNSTPIPSKTDARKKIFQKWWRESCRS